MMRTLQAGFGNALISRHWQRTRTGAILARYEAGEHALLGGPGKTLKIGAVDVTEGELAAMGDFYKDPQSMETDIAAAKTNFEKLLADIRTDREQRATGKEGIAESVWVSDTEHRPAHERYLDLAADNFAHFAPGKNPGPNHKSEWEKLHKQALDLRRRPLPATKWFPTRRESSTRSRRTSSRMRSPPVILPISVS